MFHYCKGQLAPLIMSTLSQPESANTTSQTVGMEEYGMKGFFSELDSSLLVVNICGFFFNNVQPRLHFYVSILFYVF